MQLSQATFERPQSQPLSKSFGAHRVDTAVKTARRNAHRDLGLIGTRDDETTESIATGCFHKRNFGRPQSDALLINFGNHWLKKQ